MSILQEDKKNLMTEFAIKEGDTGSVDVQCAVLTERIKNLTEHLKDDNHKDFQARRGLLAMVTRRRKLLRYLERKDKGRCQALKKRLGLRK